MFDYSDNFEIYTNSITVTAPDNSSSWKIDSFQHIYWESTGHISMVNIELFRDGNFEIAIASDVSNNGSYYWTLPSDLHISTNYQVKITDASDSSVYDLSAYFEISNGFLISGYNPIFLLTSAMGGISLILILRRRKHN